MGRKVVVTGCTLNQWALDFEGNFGRIIQSVQEEKELGASYRTAPEFEVCGHSCEEHFHELDTHSWQVLAKLLKSATCKDMLVDVGMPVTYRNVSNNCRIAFFNKKIFLIRSKMMLCEDGNYRKTRWFLCWTKEVIMATIDLEDIRSYRTQIRSRSHLAASNAPFPRVNVDFALSDDEDIHLTISPPIEWKYLTLEEDIR